MNSALNKLLLRMVVGIREIHDLLPLNVAAHSIFSTIQSSLSKHIVSINIKFQMATAPAKLFIAIV